MKDRWVFGVLTPSRRLNDLFKERTTHQFSVARETATKTDGVVNMGFIGHSMLAFACSNNLCKQCVNDKACIMRTKYTFH